VGSPAPDFTTGTLDGKAVHLSDLKGKAVLLNFWATWCAACRSEMPAIQKALDGSRERGFEVIGINFRESNQAAMRRFLEGAGVRYGSALDPDGKIADAYNVTAGLPVSIFIDRQGAIALIQVGLMSEDFINQQVAGLLSPVPTV